jgi:hypothetical protein
VLLALSALYVAAGGALHLIEWDRIYRRVPSNVPGAAVVRIGFPINAAVSLVLAGLLVAAIFLVRRRGATTVVLAAALAFQVTSLLVLVQTRIGSVFAWMEPAWTNGARQTAAVEGAAIVALLAVIVLRSAPDIGGEVLPGQRRP